MFARVTRYRGSPEKIEEGLRIYREEVIPWLRDATGFRGWLVLINRERGATIGVTFWAAEEAMHDTEATGGVLRDEVAASIEATMESMEFYELAVAEALALDEAP